MENSSATGFHLTITDWVGIVVALSTVIYTAGSLMLWWTTRMQLNMYRMQSIRQQEIDRLQHISMVHKNFRELFMSILNDERNLSIFRENVGSASNDEVRKNYMASLLINNCYELFEMNRSNMLESHFWLCTVKDMRSLFDWPFIKARWSQIHSIYSDEFRIFIDKDVILLNIK